MATPLLHVGSTHVLIVATQRADLWGALLVPAIIVYTNHTVSVLC